jgi:hypothetical protein
MRNKRAIVHLTWHATVLLNVTEDFEPDNTKIGYGLTLGQLETAWRRAEESRMQQFHDGIDIHRGRLAVSGWTKNERYYPD